MARLGFALALALLCLSSASLVQPLKEHADAVVPETELVTSSWCSFSVCPIGSPGYRKDCLPTPSTCTFGKKDHCYIGECAEGTGDLHFGEAADVAGIQPECYTLHSTGGVCNFDESRTDCAVCKPGACQCSEGTAAGHNRCMPCAEDEFTPAPGCVVHVPPPDACAPETHGIPFEKHANSFCRGHDKDLLNDYHGTAEQCKAKCLVLGCQGFLFTPQQSSAYASQLYGKCDFRGGPLQPIVESKDNTDCYALVLEQ